MRVPTGVISSRSPLREPIFSMTAPTLSAGTSTTSRSIGSHFLPSIVLVQHARGRDLELIALAAHGLDEDGQAHLAAARDVEGVGGALDLGHPQGNVLERLAEQALAQLAGGDELALACPRRGNR